MNPLKDRQIYIYVEYSTYIRLHVVLQMKFKAIYAVIKADTRIIYDYILACQPKQYIYPVGEKMYGIDTQCRTFLNHSRKVRYDTQKNI